MRTRRIPQFSMRLRAFTLVEVLLVVALLGVLLAIALPTYGRYQDKVRTRKAIAEITMMSAIVQAHFQTTGQYPASLASAEISNWIDPWGRPYVYYNIDENGKGHARKDHALNPLNTDFDLYSSGPDGVSKPQITQKDSVDDILRASNGAFVGIAANF